MKVTQLRNVKGGEIMSRPHDWSHPDAQSEAEWEKPRNEEKRRIETEMEERETKEADDRYYNTDREDPWHEE